jgi:tetratricopeptide (TPR) repeat protein
MRTFPDLRMRQLTHDAERAQELLDQNQHREARDLFGEVRARAKRLGLASAHLDWGFAVASDYLGETEMAFEGIREAVTKDPFNPMVQRSFDIIAGRLRAALADAARAPEDASTPRLYRLLLAAGEADVSCHVAMARHLAHAGDAREAMRLLDAVTLLAPASRDAWLQKAALARAAGDAALAAECDAQAAALATADVPFGIPGPPGATC